MKNLQTSRYKLSRSLRLNTKEQFSRVFNNATKITTKIGALLYCKNDLAYSRLGVVVPKKNIKKATTRNYCKRLVREEFRYWQNQLSGVDIIFLIYHGAETVSRQELHKYISKLLEELNRRQKIAPKS